MSSSNPPNPNTPPQFNNDAFLSGENPTIDVNYLNANYLQFPFAQGTENLGAINVAGTATHTGLTNFNAAATANANLLIGGTPAVNYIQFPDGTRQYTSSTSGVGSLNDVLAVGNTATGTTATIGLTNTGTGGLANPQLTLTNSNATINTIPTIELNKTGRNLTTGESVGSISMYGLDATAQKTEFARIQTKAENVASGNEDGTLSIFNSVNGVISETFNFNGGQNENNSFRPLDMNGNALRTTTTNLTLDATASTGTGDIFLTPKVATGFIKPSKDILTDNSIQTLSATGGSIINFAGGNADERFNIDKNDITLHWNNAAGEQADIVLENDLASLNSAINFNYQTTSGSIGTNIQNIPTIHRIVQSDSINNKGATYSPQKVELTEGSTRIAKLENSVNSGENRMDLFLNSGGGISDQAGIANQTNNQTLYLVHTDNSNSKSLQLLNPLSSVGGISYSNTIDSSAFVISSNNTDLTLSSVSNCNINSTALNFNSVNIIPRRTYNTFAFSVNGSPSATILNFGSLADMVANTIWKVDVAFYTGDGINTSNVLTYVVQDTTPTYVETNSVFGYTQGGLQTCIQYDPTGTPMGTYCSFTDTFEVSNFAVGACSFILTGGTSNSSTWSGTCRVSIVLTRLS